MKQIIFLMVLVATLTSSAHDDGHGPKATDSGKFGGLVASVVLKKEDVLGAKAKLVYKSELVRSADGTTRMYLYDEKMNLLNTKDIKPQATASVSSKIKGKWTSQQFALDLKDGVFIGKMPKPQSKPYNVDIVFSDKSNELLTAFDNLD